MGNPGIQTEVLPSSIDAEKVVLGAILLDNEAFYDGAADLKVDDFYLASHRTIFSVMSEILFGMVEGVSTADIVTIPNELNKRKLVSAVGGVSYIASLTEGMPRRPVITNYIAIIKEKAKLRAMTEILSAGLSRAADQSESYDQISSEIQGSLSEVSAESQSHTFTLGEITPTVTDDVRKSSSLTQDREALEYTWGIPGMDSTTHGLFRGEFTVLSGESGGGKLMDVNELIPTPSGFVKNGDLKDGGRIFGENGEIYEIVQAHPIKEEEAFKVSFDDGTFTYVHEGHLWQTWTCSDRRKISKRRLEFRLLRREKKRIPGGGKRPSSVLRRVEGNGNYNPAPIIGTVKTTKEIMETLYHGRGKNHAIPVASPLNTEEKTLPLDPYVLGAWLGDGTSRSSQITIGDHCSLEMSKILSDHGWPVRKLKTKLMYTFSREGSCGDEKPLYRILGDMGLLMNKHIPEEYFWSSQEQRLELLKGLMDTDGCCNADGQCEFTSMNKNLAEGVYRLSASLGLKPFWEEGLAKIRGRITGKKYRTKWTSNLQCFYLEKKKSRVKKDRHIRTKWRYISNVEPVGKMKMRCITTNNPTGLYLFGKNCNVTHNTVSALQTVLSNAEEGTPCGIFSIEMTKEKLVRRLYPMMSEIITSAMTRDPRLMSREVRYEEMNRVSQRLNKLPIYIDDTSPIRIDTLCARVKMLRRKFGVKLFVVDYLQLIEGMPGVNEAKAFRDTVFMLRDLPKSEPDIHLLVLSQYSKADGFTKKMKRGKDSLYGGAVIHHAAQNIVMIDMEDPEKRDKNDLLDTVFRIAKQREGGRMKVSTFYDRDHLKFVTAKPLLGGI